MRALDYDWNGIKIHNFRKGHSFSHSDWRIGRHPKSAKHWTTALCVCVCVCVCVYVSKIEKQNKEKTVDV